MPKFGLQFVTEIRGTIMVEADNMEAAEAIGEEMAVDTLNYEDLSDGGNFAPDVETEFIDLYEEKI